MSPVIQDGRTARPSILTTFRPIEAFWDSIGHPDSRGPELEQVLNPLDAFLTHLVLELVPGLPALVDLAAEGTDGATSLIGLNHPHVRRVVASIGGDESAAVQALPALKLYLRGRPGLAPLDVLPKDALSADLAGQAQVVILIDARVEDPAALADEVGGWLEELPDAVVLVLGLGRVGECGGIESLLRLCAAGAGRRFALMRELEESLAASGLGVVSRLGHPYAAEVLERIQLLHAGNYRQLDLMKAVNQAAMREAGIDAEVARSHPSFGPLRGEMNHLNWVAETAKGEANQVSLALAAAQAEIHELRHALHTERAASQATLVFRARRKLSATVVGKSWRLSKRVMRKGLSRLR